MSKERYILEGKSFVDTETNQCLNFGIKDLVRVTILLNNMNMWLDQDKEQIADLEAKLAEKDNTITNLIEDSKVSKELLKKQLANKEKEIETINKEFVGAIHNWKELCNKKDQDKISFAVEQFEQIFSDFNKKVYDEFGDNDVKYITLDIEDVNFYLQDKIKSIKELK